MSGRIDLDEAMSLWLAGHRYAGIAVRFGVSRQAVEQMRDRYPKAFPPRDWVTVAEAAVVVQVARTTLSRWLAEGTVPTSPDGLVRVVDMEAMIVQLWTRQCEYPGCTHDVEGIEAHRRFCPEHIVEARRYSYPVLSPEAQRRHHEAVARWQAKNPERAREIRQRAGRAYRQRQQEKAS